MANATAQAMYSRRCQRNRIGTRRYPHRRRGIGHGTPHRLGDILTVRNRGVVSRTVSNTRCLKSAYASGTLPSINRRALAPKLVPGARPGNTSRTRTSNGANSNASDSVNAFTAALLPV